MSRRRADREASTTPMPFESITQTEEWWRAFWDAQRREEERRLAELRVVPDGDA